MKLNRVGIWTGAFDMVPARQAQQALADLEAQGWDTVWIPETVGRDGLVFAGVLLAGSSTIKVATGIVNIWGRDAMAMKNGQLTLAEAYPDRFILGMGVSHQPLIEGLRNHQFRRPLDHMRAYLDAMDTALYVSPQPEATPVRVLAALGPKMLDLAKTRADGAHTYLVTPEHTAMARAALGPEPILAVEQKVVMDQDPVTARATARQVLALYLGLPNYTNNLKRLGFSDADLAEGGSDHLVDSLVAWGDLDTIRSRVKAHLDAGASHVCVQVLAQPLEAMPQAQWAQLAPVLVDL